MRMRKKTVHDLHDELIRDECAVLRADFNVPLGPKGGIADDTRVRATLPTLLHLLERGGRVVILSHMGRPGGRVDSALSLRAVGERLDGLLKGGALFCGQAQGEEASAAARELRAGQVLLLENTRFLEGEESNDVGLAGWYASLGGYYVNDAFGTAHRAHASTEGVARQMRAGGGEAVAGLLMDRELHFLGGALTSPVRPFVAIIGGAKVSGKLELLEALLPRVDRLIIGGAMANTFFLALGLEVGDSLVEHEMVQVASDLLDRAGDKILLPVDVAVADSLEEEAQVRVTDRVSVRPGERIGDVGPRSRDLFLDELSGAATVLWNGPMGVFELASFAQGTLALAQGVARATDRGATTVLGGGDSAAAVELSGVTERISHVSTGGGAALEFLAGAELPGVGALSEVE